MNRQNFFGHLALALTLVLLAGLAGQLTRWQNERQARHNQLRRHSELYDGERTEFGARVEVEERAEEEQMHSSDEGEVLVRFRAGTSLERIRNIARRLNDRLEDEYETVNGLVAIDDDDGLGAEEVASEYALLDEVEYA